MDIQNNNSFSKNAIIIQYIFVIISIFITYKYSGTSEFFYLKSIRFIDSQPMRAPILSFSYSYVLFISIFIMFAGNTIKALKYSFIIVAVKVLIEILFGADNIIQDRPLLDNIWLPAGIIFCFCSIIFFKLLKGLWLHIIIISPLLVGTPVYISWYCLSIIQDYIYLFAWAFLIVTAILIHLFTKNKLPNYHSEFFDNV